MNLEKYLLIDIWSYKEIFVNANRDSMANLVFQYLCLSDFSDSIIF